MKKQTKKNIAKLYLLLLLALYVVFIPYGLLATTVGLIVYFTIIFSIYYALQQLF